MQEIKVGLLGFGTIGTGVVKVFQQNAKLLQDKLGASLVLAKIADLDITTERGVIVDDGVLTTDAHSVIDDPDIPIIIELIGGYEPARSFVLRAIGNGKHVITANKALLALHGEEIFQAADTNGVEVLFEAAVGGGIPIISPIKESLGANRFQSVLGILNGTCNFILTKMTEEGDEFSTVLEEAQEMGYAEADPTFDIEGVDTAHKLAVLTSLCFGTRVKFKEIYTEGISDISAMDIEFAKQFGYKIKLLAISKVNNGAIEARVHPTMIPFDYPLADVDGVFNAVRLEGDFVGSVVLQGPGAGMNATASAVMGDVMSVCRNLLAGIQVRTPSLGFLAPSIGDIPIKPMDELVGQYYLRFAALDKPGVLAQIAGILGKHHISIASMIQPERLLGEVVPIVIMTHEAQEANVRQALEEIDNIYVIKGKSRLIRIEEAVG